MKLKKPLKRVGEDEFGFWKEVLNLLNAFSNKPLTDRELEVVAYFMTAPTTINNPLHGKSRKLCKEFLGISEQTLAMHFSNAKSKGWFVDSDDTERKVTLTKSLRIIWEGVKVTNDFTLAIPLIIMKKDEGTRQSDRRNGQEVEHGHKSDQLRGRSILEERS